MFNNDTRLKSIGGSTNRGKKKIVSGAPMQNQSWARDLIDTVQNGRDAVNRLRQSDFSRPSSTKHDQTNYTTKKTTKINSTGPRATRFKGMGESTERTLDDKFKSVIIGLRTRRRIGR